MHKESFYQFILYVLSQEGRSNLPFRIESMLLGKRRASKRWFFRLFNGCDIPSFLHLQKQFNEEHPQYSFAPKVSDIKTDTNGLMTGEMV
jgi:hypothetical protein